MLELLYIGRLDYLARHNIHNPMPLPDDLVVEEAFLKLKATAEHVSSDTDATESSNHADNETLKNGN